MHKTALMAGVAALALSLAGCNCQQTVTTNCQTDQDCGGGGRCVSGTCVGGTGGGTGQGGGAGGGAGGGSTVVTGCDPQAADNATRDTDCDGISDAEEYGKAYPGGTKTDPCNADTDGDGIRDGTEVGKVATVVVCAGFVADGDPNIVSDPTRSDTDGDGLPDGQEDKNQDGKVDPGESNPARIDSDCDGLSDKAETDNTYACALDPLRLDTDGDGLPDGVEVGLQQPGADSLCQYTAIVFDADAANKTSPCNPDSDGDGIPDGAEDSNSNGRVDPGELDPNNPADATGPAQQVCTTANLRPINFHRSQPPDTQVALVPPFAEVQVLNDGTADRGLAFFDATNKVAGLILSKTPAGASATAEETDGRSKIGSTGTLSAPITQTFTTWDGFAGTVRATYDQAGNADLKARVNAIAQAYLGGAVTGTLPGAAGVTGPFKVQAEYIRRTATRSVVLVVLTPASLYTGANVFNMDDVAGGSAVAQAPDYTAPQCEVFLSSNNASVDFLWVVDNSGSMGSYQAAVGNAGTLFGQKLATAGVDWRVGATTTDYYNSSSNFRAFTNSVATMQTWFASSGTVPPRFGTSGSATEMSLRSAREYIAALLPKTTTATTNKVRTDAALHLILLGDADDQSSDNATTFTNFFNNYDGQNGTYSKAVVHGIVCPQGQTCSETQANPRKNLAVIQATGGVLGDINIAQSGSPQLSATLDAILAAAIAGTGHQLLRPPLSATIKVAVEANGTRGPCNTNDLPRDRANGFDFDSASRRIVFYGNCIPNGAGKKVAVSYKYWLDGSPDPNGCYCAPPKVCGPNNSCVCPTNCGGQCTGSAVCDMNTCGCININ